MGNLDTGRITAEGHSIGKRSGIQVSVDMAAGRYTDELRSCLVGVFRDMRYPEFDGLSMPVSFPIYIR